MSPLNQVFMLFSTMVVWKMFYFTIKLFQTCFMMWFPIESSIQCTFTTDSSYSVKLSHVIRWVALAFIDNLMYTDLFPFFYKSTCQNPLAKIVIVL